MERGLRERINEGVLGVKYIIEIRKFDRGKQKVSGGK
jgi:hypothetical protein